MLPKGKKKKGQKDIHTSAEAVLLNFSSMRTTGPWGAPKGWGDLEAEQLLPTPLLWDGAVKAAGAQKETERQGIYLCSCPPICGQQND